MSSVYDLFSRRRKKLGFFQALRWTVIEVLVTRGLLTGDVTLRPPNCAHGVRIRLHDSDWDLFRNVFLEKELEFAASLTPPALIMDLGANVGYTVIYFLSLFPAAGVIAVEPDPANLEVCRANLKPYKRVQLVRGAIWPSRSPLLLSRGTFRDGRAWATEVRVAKAGEAGDVEGWNIPDLLAASGQDRIGLLKINIEGSEQALFSHNASVWLNRVDNLFVEVHGPECRDAVADGLSGYDFIHSQWGEHHLYLNIRCKDTH